MKVEVDCQLLLNAYEAMSEAGEWIWDNSPQTPPCEDVATLVDNLDHQARQLERLTRETK